MPALADLNSSVDGHGGGDRTAASRETARRLATAGARSGDPIHPRCRGLHRRTRATCGCRVPMRRVATPPAFALCPSPECLPGCSRRRDWPPRRPGRPGFGGVGVLASVPCGVGCGGLTLASVRTVRVAAEGLVGPEPARGDLTGRAASLPADRALRKPGRVSRDEIGPGLRSRAD